MVSVKNYVFIINFKDIINVLYFYSLGSLDSWNNGHYEE